ncbi:MAG TPA: histidine kinase [Bacteroidales bacterium]|jgi:signal transduction histidine kinase|nr:HAMP domain-containing protein [Bacteroidales bacterium]HNV95936.1 histidine kinase [Bacteroidales bacterium]
MKGYISISEKLILYFIAITLFIITLIGSLNYYYAKKAIINRTFDQLISLRIEKQKRVESFFKDRIYEINQSSKIYNLNALSNNIDTGLLIKYTYLSNVYLLKNQKTFSLSPYNKETEEYILKTSKSITHFNNIYIKDITPENQNIYIFKKIDNKENYLVFEIPIANINKIMYDYSGNNGLGKTGETYIVGSDSLMRSNSRFFHKTILKIKVKSGSVKKALQGQTGTDIISDYRNIRCLSSYSPLTIEGLKWIILAEIDEKETMKSISAIRDNILITGIFIAGFIFILAFFISKRITLPIKRLQKASEEITKGNYNINIELASNDEIGTLTETFNKMIYQIKEQSKLIEEEKIKRISSLIDGQEMERKRLARDLHDSLGQMVLAANLKLEQSKNSDDKQLKNKIIETQELLKIIIKELRVISNNLTPSVLINFGLNEGLNNICNETKINTGINIQYKFENIDEKTISEKDQIYIYRIVQEAINNITKHSKAQNAIVSLYKKQNNINLCIEDDGCGFSLNQKSKGNGIANLQERVKLLNGSIEIETEPGAGTRIKISIPV